jgi:hypothetical protein
MVLPSIFAFGLGLGIDAMKPILLHHFDIRIHSDQLQIRLNRHRELDSHAIINVDRLYIPIAGQS